jgi:hypothetical protein
VQSYFASFLPSEIADSEDDSGSILETIIIGIVGLVLAALLGWIFAKLGPFPRLALRYEFSSRSIFCIETKSVYYRGSGYTSTTVHVLYLRRGSREVWVFPKWQIRQFSLLFFVLGGCGALVLLPYVTSVFVPILENSYPDYTDTMYFECNSNIMYLTWAQLALFFTSCLGRCGSFTTMLFCRRDSPCRLFRQRHYSALFFPLYFAWDTFEPIGCESADKIAAEFNLFPTADEITIPTPKTRLVQRI